MARRTVPRELAYGGLFGAAALLLPVLFHLVQLGRVFMPMYLPLMALAFLVRPATAATTAALVPLLSAAATGMPPWYPPVAPAMALELAAMAAIIATVRARLARINDWLLLGVALLVGRGLYGATIYAISLLMGLPAEVLTTLSLLGGWPGIVLMMVVVPPFVSYVDRRRSPRRAADWPPRSSP